MTSIWVVPVKDDISAFKIKSKLVVNFLILSLSVMKGYNCDVFILHVDKIYNINSLES